MSDSSFDYQPYPAVLPVAYTQQHHTPKPLPIIFRPNATSQAPLPSFDIDHSQLITDESVLTKYTKLKTESKSGTLAVKLARKAIFGNSVRLLMEDSYLLSLCQSLDVVQPIPLLLDWQ